MVAGFLSFNVLVGSMFLATSGWARSVWLATLLLCNPVGLLAFVLGPKRKALREQADLQRHATAHGDGTVRLPMAHQRNAVTFAKRLFGRQKPNWDN